MGTRLAGTDGNVAFELDILAYDCLGMDSKFVSTGNETMSHESRRGVEEVRNHIAGMASGTRTK